MIEGLPETPTISAVIAAYNSAEFIERALTSIYAQTYPVSEAIVVDDGSTDETVALVRERFPAVRVLAQENAGPAVAYNRGVAAATGELVALLDSDDEWLPPKLARQVQVLRDHPFASGVLCACQTVRSPEEPSPPPSEGQVFEVGFRTWFLPYTGPPIPRSTSSWLMRREVFSPPFGGMDETLRCSNDYEALLRLGALGYRLMAISEPLFRWYLREGSLSHSRRTELARAEHLPAFVRRYNPAAWPEAPITPSEYRTQLQRTLKRSVGFAVKWDEPELARRNLAEAAAHPGDDPWLRREMALGARLPGLYLAIRRRAGGRRNR